MAMQFLTLEMAKKAATAAHAEAKKNGWAVTITILDQSGLLAYVERMDDAPVSSMEISRQKGHAAIAFKRPTKAFEEQLAGGRIAVLRLQGCIPVEGGIPLVLANGDMVGAIGISGVTSVQDGQVAKAGADALLK
jgi:uncharacterized protein GlcG (DUF336 family)